MYAVYEYVGGKKIKRFVRYYKPDCEVWIYHNSARGRIFKIERIKK